MRIQDEDQEFKDFHVRKFFIIIVIRKKSSVEDRYNHQNIDILGVRSEFGF